VSADRSDVPAGSQLPSARHAAIRRRPGGARARPDAPAPFAGALVWAGALAGALAAYGSLRPWTRATLADRGADLLVVNQSGWDLAPSGQCVCVLGVVAALVCVFIRRTGRSRWAWYALPAAGALIVAITLTRIDAGGPDARKLERLRIGTFQTDHPVVADSAGAGLWICLVAGVVIAAVVTVVLVLDRRARGTTPASEPRGTTPATEPR
jgi:hypothetical protein